MRLVSGMAASMSVACTLSLGLACAVSFAQSIPTASTQPQLSVAPIPTAADPSPGTPQVTWATGNGSPGQVTVSSGQMKETLFAVGPEGSNPAPWISARQRYIFRLYSLDSGRRLIARLAVGQNEPLDVVMPAQTPRMTSPFVNRLLQVLPYGFVALLTLLTALYLRDLRRS
jgi:hypothetical protein